MVTVQELILRIKVVEKLSTSLIWLFGLLTLLPGLALLFAIVFSGWETISWQFLVQSPYNFGRSGGIAPILISTVIVLGVSMSVALPVGLGCSLYWVLFLNQNSVLLKRVSFYIDILAAVPSIVFGLFGYAFFSQACGLGFSLLAGGLSLGCMVLPLFIQLSFAVLNTSHDAYVKASHALNISYAGYVRKVLLPGVAPQLFAVILLCLGRALAETAVLLFTAGYVMTMPSSLLDSGRVLAVHIYDLALNVAGGQAVASGTALVLILLVIGFMLASHILLSVLRRKA